MRHSVSVEPSFPLTLTLSLGEREQPQRGTCCVRTAMANSVTGMAQRRRTILPLPRGEYLLSVAAGVPPDVEPGILPGGLSCGLRRHVRVQSCHSGRQDAVLHDSQVYQYLSKSSQAATTLRSAAL